MSRNSIRRNCCKPAAGRGEALPRPREGDPDFGRPWSEESKKPFAASRLEVNRNGLADIFQSGLNGFSLGHAAGKLGNICHVAIVVRIENQTDEKMAPSAHGAILYGNSVPGESKNGVRAAVRHGQAGATRYATHG